MAESSSNKTIAKNTFYLYTRMFISLFISIFTSRVVLRTLGVEDYGIHNVVGGVIGMFGIIQTSMIGATSRFITYEMGKGDKKRLNDTFCTTMTVHIIIALILFIILETFGLWFVNYKLVIPENRMFAANCIYQFSILSTMLGVTQTPYGACIVAHEKMNVYAYMEIWHVTMKLLVLYLLAIGNFDKLILYGILTLVVSTLTRTIYRVYCIKNFPESHFHFIWRKDLLKPIFAFSGWDVFGNVAVMARGQGVTMLINMFFGPVMNAASGIGNSITAAVSGFSSNIIVAIRPQLIKSYAKGDYMYVWQLLCFGIRVCFLLMTCLMIPLINEIHFVLKLWLGFVPNYACEFAILSLFFSLINCFAGIVMIVVHATGRIKKTSIGNGFIYIMVIPITYLSFKLGAPSWTPFLYNDLAFMCGMLWNSYLMCSYIKDFSYKQFVYKNIIPCILIFVFVCTCIYSLKLCLEEGWTRLILSIILTLVLTLSISLTVLFDPETRYKLKIFIMERLRIRKKSND